MPFGSILLLIVSVAVLFGLLHRVLDRMGLTDWGAILFIALIVAGGYVNIVLISEPELRVNAGGALVPLFLAVYLFRRADTRTERARLLVATLLTGAAVFILGRVLPEDPGDMWVSPLWLFSLSGGLIAYVLGRSRRSAFAAGTMGIIVADVLQYAEIVALGLPGRIWLGGGGAFDTAIIAGVVAVGVAELVGEIRERLHCTRLASGEVRQGD